MELRDHFGNLDYNWEQLPMSAAVNEATGEKVDTGILAKVKGPFFTVDGVSENRRVYSRKLWENTITKYNEKLAKGGTIGTVGHDNGLDEKAILEGKISHIVKKLWIDDSNPKKPIGMGELHVLNTPAGQSMNSLLRAGVKIPVSSRAFGSYKGKTPNNEDIIDEDTFDLHTFDYVLSPGIKTAYPGVYESLTSEEKHMSDSNTEKRLIEANLDLQGELSAIVKVNEDLVAKADAATRKLQEVEERLGKSSKVISFYRKNVGTPDQVKRLDEGLRKWLELEPLKTAAGQLGLLDLLGDNSDTAVKKLLGVTEAYRALGTQKEIQGKFALNESYAAKGTPEEVDKLMAVSESYMKFGSPENVKKIVEGAKAYRKLGSIADIKKVFGIVEKYLAVGSPKQISEKLAAAAKMQEGLKKTQKANTARKIAEHFNMPLEVITEQLQYMPAAKVIEIAKKSTAVNFVADRYKVSESATKVVKGAVPGAKKSLTDKIFESMNHAGDRDVQNDPRIFKLNG